MGRLFASVRGIRTGITVPRTEQEDLCQGCRQKKSFTLDEFKKQMTGIYSTTISKNTLDESPMAYKNIDDILKNISPTAKVLKHIKPIYNFKADA